ncbi:uncharacterized protein LOC123505909 isoform X3 [Portunus trituberculatus]|uniref:uncharacterized protein LOC123505909 isoform X3 n=1 Tax=Portunus trituberculatus TaxID=210409 RepID=UPI001E1CFEF2|nr:uncharacterized protein LOC123505909 isoform X3 [Portunus trituberculatus]
MKAERGASVRHSLGVKGHTVGTTQTYSPPGLVKPSLARPCERRAFRAGGSLTSMSRSLHYHWGSSQEQPTSQGTHHKQTCFSWLQVFLTLLTVLPSMAKGPQGTSHNTLGGYGSSLLGKNGIFLQANHSDITAQAGATATLPCRLSSPLGDGMVSWVRRRDYHLLTVGRQVYSSDARVGVKVSMDGSDWMLTVRYVAPHDAGLYECQVSSHPPQLLMVNLHVVEAHAEIMGTPERYIHHGSSLKLVCLLKGATEPPVYVFWYRGERMINYDKERGVTVDNSRKTSKLYVASVSRRDEGNYTCVPSNAAAASVVVTVIQSVLWLSGGGMTSREEVKKISVSLLAGSDAMLHWLTYFLYSRRK